VSEGADRREQRLSERHSFISFCWYKRIDDRAKDSEEAVARLRDVSAGGIGMMTGEALPVDARLLVEIVSQVGRVSVLCRVTHCSPTQEQGFRVGLKVDAVPPNDQMAWRRILSS
jgi:hypothetical protein